MDANIKNVPNKVSMIATGLSTQYGATGSCAVFSNAWCPSGVCFQANRPHNNKNAPIRNTPILYIYFRSLIIIMIVPPAPNIIQNIPPILLIDFFLLNICHPHNDMNKNKSIMPYLSTYLFKQFINGGRNFFNDYIV